MELGAKIQIPSSGIFISNGLKIICPGIPQVIQPKIEVEAVSHHPKQTSYK